MLAAHFHLSPKLRFKDQQKLKLPASSSCVMPMPESSITNFLATTEQGCKSLPTCVSRSTFQKRPAPNELTLAQACSFPQTLVALATGP